MAAPAAPDEGRRRPGLRHLAEYAAVRTAAAVFSLAGARLASSLARGLARLYFLADRRHRRVAIANIQRHWGVRGPEARLMARRSFEHVFVNVVEVLHADREIARRGFDDVFVTENADALERALAAGKGVVLVTAHFGNWEAVARIARSRGWPFTTIYRPLGNPLLDAWIRRLRSAHGQEMVPKQGALRPFLAALRRGGMAVLLVDQDARSHGILVPFLGTPASTIATPAELALRTGAALVTAFTWRTGPGFRHTVRIDDPMDLAPTGDRAADVVRITTEINRRLEGAMRNAPEQWLWGHRRWKSSPQPPAAPSPGAPESPGVRP